MSERTAKTHTYTPGPWRASPYSSIVGIAITAPSMHIAGVRGQIPVATANARLIAAAPDMLEVLQAAWNCIAELPPTQARVEVAQMIQSAIEKAIGNE